MTKIYTENEKFYINENGNITELTQTVFEKKTGETYFKLPDNESNRKLIRKSLIERKGEIELTYKETRVLGQISDEPKKSTKAPKLNELVELLTDDERAIYKELMDKAATRLAQKKKLEALEAMKAEVARLEAELNGEV